MLLRSLCPVLLAALLAPADVAALNCTKTPLNIGVLLPLSGAQCMRGQQHKVSEPWRCPFAPAGVLPVSADALGTTM